MHMDASEKYRISRLFSHEMQKGFLQILESITITVVFLRTSMRLYSRAAGMKSRRLAAAPSEKRNNTTTPLEEVRLHFSHNPYRPTSVVVHRAIRLQGMVKRNAVICHPRGT